MDYTLHMLSESLKREGVRRIAEESIHRIHICIDKLSNEQIWHRPNANTNSVGHLVLHLCGNARQWIGSGIGGKSDHRNRSWEFTTEEQFSKDYLHQQLNDLSQEIQAIIHEIQPEEWLEIRKVQVFDESVLSILIHVIEHFSYHTGQITQLTKLYIDQDLKYYGDLNLEIQ